MAEGEADQGRGRQTEGGTVDLSIIILNWNTRTDLEQCLRSIFSRAWSVALEIIVVDNASEDDSVQMVRTQFPEARVLANDRNLGFTAGNNRGIPLSSGRYVMFLNSDTVMTDGALDALVRYADSRPDAAVFGPKLLNSDGSLQYSCRSFPNLGTGFFRNTPLGRLFPRNRFNEDYLLTGWDHATPRDVDWVSGSALMIRRDVVLKLNGFDEGFFMYCEDVDLCYRVHELGMKVAYCPSSVIYHHIGRSSDQVPTRMTFEFHRSMYRFYRKHYRTNTPWHIRPLILPGLAARAAGKLVRYRLYSLGKQLAARRRGRR